MFSLIQYSIYCSSKQSDRFFYDQKNTHLKLLNNEIFLNVANKITNNKTDVWFSVDITKAIVLKTSIFLGTNKTVIDAKENDLFHKINEFSDETLSYTRTENFTVQGTCNC